MDKKEKEKTIFYLLSAIISVMALLALFFSSQYNYLLFHTVAEIFSIIVASMIFIITWHTRKKIDYGFYIVLGLGFLSVAFLDLAHTLAYSGLNVFPGYGVNLPTQLWISARFVQALTFLAAPFFIKRDFPLKAVMAGYGLLVSGFSYLAFSNGFSEVFFSEGQGLTTVKIYSEYAIMTMLASSAVILWRKREKFSRQVLLLLMVSIVLNIISEASFTLYVDPYGFMNFVGHTFKIISFMIIYKAVVAISLDYPQATLYYELKKSEEALKKSERKYQDLFGNMTSGFALHRILTDRSGKFIDYEFVEANPAYGMLTGLDVSGIIGRKAAEVIPHQSAGLIKLYEEIAAGKKEAKFEEYSAALNKWFAVTAFSPRKGYFATILDDITEAKTAAQNLKESRAMYRILTETSPDCIKLFDLKGRLQYINRAGLEEHGLKSLDEAKKWDYLESIAEEHKSSFKQALANATQGRMERIEIRHKAGSSNRDVCLETLVPIRNSANKVVNILASSKDITEEKNASGAKTEFFSMASHQLRTPLTNIGFNLEALEMDFSGTLNDEQREYVCEAKESVEQMKDLISRLLNISRIEEGTFTDDPKEIDLNKFMLNIKKSFELFAGKKHILLEYRPGKLPEKLEIDTRIFKNILQNLISNAIKYTPEGGRVIIEAESGNPQIIFTVRDTGPGIPKEQRNKVFSKMYKAYGLLDVRERKSSGLGLYIAKIFTESIGGQIWFETEEGKGTTFRFSVPVKAVKKPA